MILDDFRFLKALSLFHFYRWYQHVLTKKNPATLTKSQKTSARILEFSNRYFAHLLYQKTDESNNLYSRTVVELYCKLPTIGAVVGTKYHILLIHILYTQTWMSRLISVAIRDSIALIFL